MLVYPFNSGRFKVLSRWLILSLTTKILDLSNLKALSDENGRNLFKKEENTVGKGEIARHEQFLLFPQCFQKACFPGASKGVIVWEWVNSFHNVKNFRPVQLESIFRQQFWCESD